MIKSILLLLICCFFSQNIIGQKIKDISVTNVDYDSINKCEISSVEFTIIFEAINDIEVIYFNLGDSNNEKFQNVGFIIHDIDKKPYILPYKGSNKKIFLNTEKSTSNN